MVFGRGVTRADDGSYTLTAASAARVRAAADYVTAHADDYRHADPHRPPLIVFSGGWAEASAGAAQPPAGQREGDLMLHRAHAAGLDRYTGLVAETRSRSTLENLLHTVEDGLLRGRRFDPAHPLGIVSHPWHLPRVRFLAGKVLKLRGAALLDVPAVGGEAPARLWSHHVTHLAARLSLLGVHGSDALLRRERTLVTAIRHAERLAGRHPSTAGAAGR
jgi:hypothetical protein